MSRKRKQEQAEGTGNGVKAGAVGKVTYHRDGSCTYAVDGAEVSQAEFAAAFPPKEMGVPDGHRTGCWPMESENLGVHPKQIPEAMARNAAAGIHVRYDPVTGNAILADRGQRRDLLRLENQHDMNGGYGDDHHISGHAGDREKAMAYFNGDDDV